METGMERLAESLTQGDLYKRMEVLHKAPKVEELARNARWVLIRSSFSKRVEEDRHSLHFYSNMHAVGAVDVDDLAKQLGFVNYDSCQFVYAHNQGCLSREINQPIALEAFDKAFQHSYELLKSVEQELRICGMQLCLGKKLAIDTFTDGHTITVRNRWLEHEDSFFRYLVVNVHEKNKEGWITHYQFKNFDTHKYAALALLGLCHYDACGFFDFEPCHWSFIEKHKYGSCARWGRRGL